MELCETHWQELPRQPSESSVMQALWLVVPPLMDLFVDLYAAGDARLDDILGLSHAQEPALLVLEEIEYGNEEGVHIVNKPMIKPNTTNYDLMIHLVAYHLASMH